ncbi:MAG TPA: hypothetical protein VFM72_00360 [Aequorivita sp.]|nr:hypothetical protein [Aequorivita sp.]
MKRWYASYGYFNDEVDYKIEPNEKKTNGLPLPIP